MEEKVMVFWQVKTTQVFRVSKEPARETTVRTLMELILGSQYTNFTISYLKFKEEWSKRARGLWLEMQLVSTLERQRLELTSLTRVHFYLITSRKPMVKPIINLRWVLKPFKFGRTYMARTNHLNPYLLFCRKTKGQM